jgi:hypothetical protein
MSEPKGRYTPLARLGDDGVLLLQCEDCGAVVTHRVVHNRWHDAQPVVDRQGEVPATQAVREQMGDAPMAAYLNVDDVSGVARIAAERVRQVQEEGWSQEHDDQHDASELVYGAITYAFAAVRAAAAGPAHVRETRSVPGPAMPYPADLWPLDPNLWKPSDDPIRNLEKAAAMLAAEIDRLIRARREDPTNP